MAEPLMSTRDVLSILGQMDMDLTQQIAAKRGIARIREVMTAFEAAAKALEEQGTVKAALEKSIRSLQGEYEARLTEEKKTFAKAKDILTAELDELKQKAGVARTRMAALTKSLEEKETFVSTRSAQLDAEMKSKSTALAKVTADFEALMKKHAVGA